MKELREKVRLAWILIKMIPQLFRMAIAMQSPEAEIEHIINGM
jgi:hypothetical protein